MPWCFCSGAALARRLYLRDNNQWLECGCGCEKGDGFGVEQVPHLYFYFPQGREFCRTLHCHLKWNFLLLFLLWGDRQYNEFTVRVLLLHTNCFYISIFLYLFALSLPLSRFPSCKALGPSLRVPVSQSHLFPWHFSPIPFPAWQGSVLQTPLEDSEITSAFCIRQKISTQAQTQTLPLGCSAPQGPFGVYKACCAVAFRESRISDRDSFCLHCVLRLLRACRYLFAGFIFVLFFLLSSYNLLAGLELARW